MDLQSPSPARDYPAGRPVGDYEFVPDEATGVVADLDRGVVWAHRLDRSPQDETPWVANLLAVLR